MTNYTSYSQRQTGLFGGIGWSRRKGLLIAVVLLILLGATIAGVVLTTKEATNQESAATAPAVQLTIGTQAGKPSTVRVQKGQSVVWQNTDTQGRVVELSGTNNAKTIFTITVGAGETYAYVFDTAGTFNYYDGENSNRLSGVIIVE